MPATSQDAWLATPSVFVVADGVSDRPCGREASQAVVESIAEAGNDQPLDAVLAAANTAVRATGQRLGGPLVPWAAVVVIRAVAQQIQVASVGDCRAYLRTDRLTRLTVDDRKPGSRPTLTKWLGGIAVPRFETGEPDVEPGNRLILVSDGIHDYLDDLSITALTEPSIGPEEAAAGLVAEARRAAGARGLVADATAVVVDVAEADQRSLTVIGPDNRTVVVPPSEAFDIGRSASAGLQIATEDPYISRRACTIRLAADAWLIEARGSNEIRTQTADRVAVRARRAEGERPPRILLPWGTTTTLTIHSAANSYPVTLSVPPAPAIVLQTDATEHSLPGAGTMQVVVQLTPEQHLVAIALCEPALTGGPYAGAPTGEAVMRRLGGLSRKSYDGRLDRICQAFDTIGVHGLWTPNGRTPRRVDRLVDCLLAGTVRRPHLAMLPPET